MSDACFIFISQDQQLSVCERSRSSMADLIKVQNGIENIEENLNIRLDDPTIELPWDTDNHPSWPTDQVRSYLLV